VYVLGFITSDIRNTFRNIVAISDQIEQFDFYPNVLIFTVGYKLRLNSGQMVDDVTKN